MSEILEIRYFLCIEITENSTIFVNFATNVVDFFVASYN